MSTYLNLINFDEVYEKNKGQSIFINDYDIFNKEIKEVIDNIIISNYTEDTISILPSCACGEIKGSYYIGTYCNKCKTSVRALLEDNLSYLLWARRVNGVEKFISPIVLKILMQRYVFTRGSPSLIEYIIKTGPFKGKRVDNEYREKIDHAFSQMGIKRGYNEFVNNFFDIINLLESLRKPSQTKRTTKETFINFLYENEDKLFSNYLPFPNKVVFSMDSTELGKFFDESFVLPISAIRRLTGIDLYSWTNTNKQNKVATTLLNMADFYYKYFQNTIFSKFGLIRQHISSTRAHFTGRAVIVTLAGPHEYDEIHLPWSLACTLFKVHIIKCLMRDGFTYMEAVRYLFYHNRIYSEKIDRIFNEILQSAGGSVSCFFNRNPSLHRGSIQSVRITHIKKDPSDFTIGMSVLIMSAPNADVDGDQMSLMLMLTENVSQYKDNFYPHQNVLSLSGVGAFSNAISLPKTVVGTMSNWLLDDE